MLYTDKAAGFLDVSHLLEECVKRTPMPPRSGKDILGSVSPAVRGIGLV